MLSLSSIKFPLGIQIVEFHENFLKFNEQNCVLPIGECSRMRISTRVLIVKADFTNDQYNFVMRHFKFCRRRTFYTINCCSQLFAKLVKELKVNFIRWWRRGQYMGFADSTFDCKLAVTLGDRKEILTADELWGMKPRILRAHVSEISTIDIIRKLREHVYSSVLQRTRVFMGPHTYQSVDDALLILGDQCQLVPASIRESLGIEYKAWKITRRTQKEPFALIRFTGKKLKKLIIGPYDSIIPLKQLRF